MMKIFQLLFVFVLLINLSACDDSKEKTIRQPAQTEEPVKEVKTIKKPIEKSNPSGDIVDFQKLVKIKPSTQYGIGRVNKQKSDGNSPIVVDGPRFTMTGWAIDSATKQLASDVYVVIDGKPFLAKYGNSRPDVAKVLGNPDLENAGFVLNIASGFIKKGQHDVKTHVVSSDGKKVFSNNDKVRVAIDVK